MNMPFKRLNVMVGVAKHEGIKERDPNLSPVTTAAKALLRGPK